MIKTVISEEKPRRSSLEVLAEMSDFLVGSLDMQEAMQIALEKLVEYLGGYLCIGLTTLENDDLELMVQAKLCSESRFEFGDLDVRYKLKDVVASRWVIENGRFLHVPDVETYFYDNARAEAAMESGLLSILYVPLMAYSRPVGIMHIDGWVVRREFTQEEIQLCQGVANLVAAAIENGRLLAAERKQLLLAQTLQKVGSVLTSQLNLDELYDQLFDLLAEVIPYDSVSIQLFDKKTQRVKLVASKGFHFSTLDETLLDEIAIHSLKKFEAGQQICIIPDTYASDLWVKEAGIEKVRSWIGALLRVKGDVIGVLNVDGYEVNMFNQEDGEMVAAFANQAAIAIENTRLYKETDRRATELSILHQLALDTASVVDLDELYARVTAVIISTLYPENFGFILLDEQSQQLFAHHSYHGVSVEIKRSPVPMQASLSGLVLETGEAYIIADVTEAPRYMVVNPDTRSEVIVPIVVDNEVIGVINVESLQLDAFSQNDLVFLMTLAGFISASVARARLYSQLQTHSENLAQEVAQQTAQLKFERDRTVTILDNAGESILLLNSGAEIMYVNRAMEIQSGYSSEQLVGQTLMILESGLSDEAVYSEFWDKLVQGKSWSGQLINKRQDGSFYDVAMTMAPVVTSEGGVTSFVVVESDITRLKEIERLKTDFVANVTHELRTPLTNIKSYVTLAERGREEKKTRYFQILHHETDRLTQLIQDLLDLSHLETEAPLPYVEPVELGQIIQEYVDIFQAKAEVKTISLKLMLPEVETAVSVEDRHLSQLLTNLLGNAILYTPDGGEVVVKAGVENEDSAQAWFQVTDNGKGIPADELPHLFRRFYRGAYGRQLGIPGTGLGLAICQEIVNRYQGKITVDSIEGVGTSVTVYLPVALPRKEIEIL